MSKRLQGEEHIYDFGSQFYIVCPQCSRCAIVQDRGAGRVVLSCRFCGSVRDDTRCRGAIGFAKSADSFDDGDVGIGAPVDWYFHQPLWLQTPCSSEILWAYNEEHLAFLEAFVQAKQRTSVRGEHGWSNQSLMNRLPMWMKLAKNRDEVLHCLEKLKQKLADYEREIAR